MRIGFDVSQTGEFKAGCGYFAESLVRHLTRTGIGNTYILYPTFGSGYWDPDWARATFLPAAEPNVVRGLGHASFEDLDAFWADPPADLEQQLGMPDIVHSNNFFCPTTLERARLVYTLHDLAFVDHPEWTTEANWYTCFRGVFDASMYADHILAVSDFTRQRFLDMFPHFRADHVSVVYESSRFVGAAQKERPPKLDQLQPRHFWLCVGTSEPRKNQRRLLEAYARLRASGETSDPLVLVGGAGWLMDDLGEWIRELNLVGYVLRLGYVDDDSLAWLYAHCTAFCYPSLYEGFGLPVVEAMSLGAAVLTSRTTSLPEVIGDAGVLVDPADPDAIYTGLRALAGDESFRANLRDHARERAQGFSWARSAAQVLDIYNGLLAGSERRGSSPDSTERMAVLGVE